MTQAMSAQQAEGRIQRAIKGWSISNILTVITLSLGGIGYFNSKFDKLMDKVSAVQTENAVIKNDQRNIESNIGEIKQRLLAQDKKIDDHIAIKGK